MGFLLTTAAPRILLAITGMLSLLLAWSNLILVMTLGLDAQAVFMTLFAALLAFICFYAAIGRTGIFSRD